MPLSPGTRFGSYEVLTAIGAGGMGEVYRARDTKLNRDVAIKVLPETFSADGDRLARFAREAQVLASLNHPNIAHIYGIEDRAIVMELVEGDDLSAIIARGPMPIDDVVPIAKQIAAALEAAHERGIIHRDLKPANIKVRVDGTVKVLDFGLAKAMDPHSPEAPAGQSPADSPTVTANATAMGMILGTAAYMSPEQAKGRAVDKRADIWAFGAVLFEMLSGHRAFKGDDVSETLAAVLRDQPDFSRLPASTPSSLRRLVERCLDRNVNTRLRDIGEARIALERPDESAAAPAGDRRVPRSSAMIAAGTLVLVAAAAAATWYAKPPASIPVRRLEMPQAMADAVTSRHARHPVMSPDGESIAYFDKAHLWVRKLDTLDPRDLGAVPAEVHALAWSPDSRNVAFAADQTLRTIPAIGGQAFVVCRIPTSGQLMSIAWVGGELMLGVWRDSLYAVPATGGEPVVRLAVDAQKEVDFHEIAAGPGGALILTTHVRAGSNVRIELVRGSSRTVLWNGGGVTRLVYAAPDTAIFQRNSPNTGIWTVPWSDARLNVEAATPVAAEGTDFSSSSDGALLYGVPATDKFGWAWLDRNGLVTSIPGTPQDVVGATVMSPDGKRVVFSARNGATTDIFVRDLITGHDTRLTFSSPSAAAYRPNPSAAAVGAVRSPSWFPSGDRVLYSQGGVEAQQLVSQRADMAEPGKPFALGESGAISADGHLLLVLQDVRGMSYLRRAAIASDGTAGSPTPVFGGGTEPTVAKFALSPNNRLLAYSSPDSVSNSLLVTAFPNADVRIPVDESSNQPRFSADGRELFYVKTVTDRAGSPSFELVSVAITSENPLKIGPPRTIYTPKAGGPSLDDFSVSLDGKRFLLRVPVPPTPGQGTKLVYVQNWKAGLKK